MTMRRFAAALPAALTLAFAAAPAGAEVCQDCPGGGGGGGTTPNKAPVASFTATPESVLRGGTVQLNGSASSDSDGSIASYGWDFTNDGTIDASGATASTSYGTLGTKTIRLVVTDNKGKTNETTRQVAVVNSGPSAGVDCDTYVELGGDVTCRADTPWDGDGHITTYQWDFDGDGAWDATGAEATWTPDEAGTFAPVLRVTDNDGAWSAASGTVIAWVPVAGDPFAVAGAVAGEPTTLTAAWGEDEQHGSATYTRTWDFGGAQGTRGPSQQNGRIATFTFAAPGTYTVRLRRERDGAADPRGTAETVQTVVVKAPQTPPPGGGGEQPKPEQPGSPQPQQPAAPASPVAQAVTAVAPAQTRGAVGAVAKSTAKKKAAAKRCSTKKAKTKKTTKKGRAKASAGAKKRKSTCAKTKKQATKKRSKKKSKR